MNYNITTIAREYIPRRYPNASTYEQEKYIADWVRKIDTSRKIIKDMESRFGEKLLGKKVFDSGTGMGGVVVAFCEAGAEVYGVEVEKELFEITQETLNAFKFEADIKLYDGYNFPFQNNLFDFAHSASVLEHTDDPEVYLGQILNALKPEGRLYLAFPNKLWPKETHTGLYFLGILPTFLQNLYIKIFNRNPLKDNNLHFYSYFNLLKILSNVNKSAASLGYKLVITEEKGNTQSGVKKAIKNVLNLLGISYKAFLPHVSVILKKVKV